MTNPSDAFEAGAEARRLIRRARYAALATIAAGTGEPYASLVSTATDPAGAPIILISRLALHTGNIAAKPAVSVLFADIGAGDPMTHPRVSLRAEAERSADLVLRRRFLARHPEAALYADFADFAFYRLRPTGAHLVAGFGRIVDLSAARVTTDISAAAGLIEAEEDALDHVNAEHRDAVALYATALLGAPPGDWRMTGIDPDGCDLALGDQVARLEFPEPVYSAADLRRRFQQLADEARSRA